ncbi:DUF3100 domain-containing protein [Bradyrhizobium sp. U87765 SZCCT0131]|uniref:DUF3100 domain-containing protein n=1 Tax=unclassified Bradyrhizobium TaxID=2631580 RepID=UPI001BA6D85D|nr:MULTISPECIES: DUF3100 domain-containing protein [unclassified Bradyrhizobium]MBR1222236.1 DUF3100 domain-containing protein [Bradyrhizobium sp. U87765 SZCCT0131]MBR1264280.1 DUF3100 domain-containing protein [Bradyrhizobium sp. U87765 SZCCT0134]MBR1307937.1 DUF3100 domain-containing protein [Bradyrhizobium sp. U87765 SZCCT0110]MBR1320530.1 DUF3100 domain-containing protein [Bradyrhizobium sp. U87765 SZCCT0109]MBR1348357.1 DUF3100 domain-containing protein [Bradyrhizobium sp. U87765 SZCCT004
MTTSTAAATAEPVPAPLASSGVAKLKLVLVVMAIVAIAESIGIVQFQVGPGKVLLQPMVWALLIAAAWGVAQRLLPAPVRVDSRLQAFAGDLLNVGLLLFVVKLGLTVGGALPQVKEAGWALLFQEFGHTFGTLVLGLPLALLLGVKREAVGATFSIGREGNLVIIGEKYGMASAEGRGVLAEYITGTVLGALFIALLAGFVTSLNIFDPRSLAMGAGVGSASMMAAAIGAINGQQPAALAPQLTAIAAASNLLTQVAGFYFTLFLSLPACSWLYDRLEPVLGRFSRRQATEGVELSSVGGMAAKELSFVDTLIAWAIMTGGVTIGNLLTYKVPVAQSLLGMAIVVAIALVVDLVKRLVPKLPMVLVLSVFATVLAVPGFLPFADTLAAVTGKLNFLTFTTPVLALAGFSVAKDLPIFRQLGWRIIVVSLTAAAGTFLGATLVAELFH